MVSSKVIDIIYESIEIVSLSGYMKTRLRESYHSPSLSKTEIKGNGSRGRLSQSICSRIFPRFNQYESDVSQWPPDSKPSRGPNKVKELSRWQRKNWRGNWGNLQTAVSGSGYYGIEPMNLRNWAYSYSGGTFNPSSQAQYICCLHEWGRDPCFPATKGDMSAETLQNPKFYYIHYLLIAFTTQGHILWKWSPGE